MLFAGNDESDESDDDTNAFVPYTRIPVGRNGAMTAIEVVTLEDIDFSTFTNVYRNLKPVILRRGNKIWNQDPWRSFQDLIDATSDSEVEVLRALDGVHFLKHELCEKMQMSFHTAVSMIAATISPTTTITSLGVPAVSSRSPVDMENDMKEEERDMERGNSVKARLYCRAYLDQQPNVFRCIDVDYFSRLAFATHADPSSKPVVKKEKEVTEEKEDKLKSPSAPEKEQGQEREQREAQTPTQQTQQAEACASANAGFVPRNMGLWVSAAGSVTPLHFDLCQGLLMQLLGRKTFLLASPADTPHMYWRHHPPSPSPSTSSASFSSETPLVDPLTSRNGSSSSATLSLYRQGGQEEQEGGLTEPCLYPSFSEVTWFVAALCPGGTPQYYSTLYTTLYTTLQHMLCCAPMTVLRTTIN